MSLAKLREGFMAGEIAKADFIRECYRQHKRLFDYSRDIVGTEITEILIRQDEVSFVIDGEFEIAVPDDEARVAPLEILNFGSYEPEEVAAFDKMAAAASCVLDVGANIGFYSVRTAMRFPKVALHAFEPLPKFYRYLTKNVALNGVTDRISCYQIGLSDRSGEAQYHATPLDGTNASLRNVSGSQEAETWLGSTVTLDEWAAQSGIVPDLIKCDVEGAELLVFRGASGTLEAHRPMILTEMLRKWSKGFGYHPNDMIAELKRHGYLCYGLSREGVRPIPSVDEATLETNYLFLDPGKHSAVARDLGIK